MAIQHVAYTNGLRTKNAEEGEGLIEVGGDVNPDMFEPEDWNYHLVHGNVVRKGGPNDPEVLAAALEPEEVDEANEDPLVTENRRLREALALYTGRGVSPAPGDHLSDVAQAEEEAQAEEDRKPSVPKAPATKSDDNK
jgi:hypothetical protein